MKKIDKFLLLVAAMILFASGEARAEDSLDKLGRGLTNVITCPGEYIVQFYVSSEGNNPLKAFFGTIVNGTIGTLTRAGAGVYDIATFPLPLPRDYSPVLMPETIFDSLHNVDGT